MNVAKRIEGFLRVSLLTRVYTHLINTTILLMSSVFFLTLKLTFLIKYFK